LTGIGALALAGVDVPAFMAAVGDCSLFGTAAKFAVTFPLTFHYLGGLRHLYWDRTPESLQNEDVEKTSYILFGTAAVLSLGAALV
jgi:succinate dehydrogenase (ubiquinone) cytochrome b560 subunit